MQLCAENYYSPVANYEYMSVSSYKDFVGTYGKAACEEQALAKMKGKWVEEKSTALLVGGYCDAYFEGTLDEYKQANPQIFKQDGGLKAEYLHADTIIRRIERDPYFMRTLSGEKQVIMTGEIGGTKWKIKMDSYLPDVAIVDLKIVESINKMKWVPDIGYLDWIRFWGYDLQGAVYQEVVRQNTGKRLPFYISAASKEKVPRISVIQIPQSILTDALKGIEMVLPHVLDVKYGRIKPIRCGLCDYCAETHVITRPISLFDLQQGI